jgi:hypothetical protein
MNRLLYMNMVGNFCVGGDLWEGLRHGGFIGFPERGNLVCDLMYSVQTDAVV